MRRKRPARSRFKAGQVLAWGSPFLALALLPPLVAAWAAAWQVAKAFSGHLASLWPFAAGAGAYALFQVAFRRPLGLYVFGHELTHALAAFLSGYKVRSFAASPKGGEVILSDTNVFVALAPYCVPLYTVFVMGLFLLAKHYGALSAPPLWCSFAVGFTLAFHVALTVYALRQRQPDLRVAGGMLSVVLIFLANCLVLVAILKLLFPQLVSLRLFAAEWLAGLGFVFGKAALGARWLAGRAAELWVGTGAAGRLSGLFGR